MGTPDVSTSYHRNASDTWRGSGHTALGESGVTRVSLRVHAPPFIKLLQAAVRNHELGIRLFMQSNKKLG